MEGPKLQMPSKASNIVGVEHTLPARRGVFNCEEILQPACGIDVYPDCLDVVFITDGKSNDPNLEICTEVKCLHSLLGIDTYEQWIWVHSNLQQG